MSSLNYFKTEKKDEKKNKDFPLEEATHKRVGSMKLQVKLQEVEESWNIKY